MPFYTYILQSLKSGRLYIGQTNNLEVRLDQHNSGKTKSTKNKGPWSIIFSIEFLSRSEAFQLETKLKKWKNKERILAWIDKQKNQAL